MIIGIVGFIGSGKGTFADILVNNYNYNKESFAKSVKDAASIIFGWDRELLEGETKTSREWREQPDPYWSAKMKQQFSPRKALQLLGTEVGRAMHKDLWLFSLQARMKENENYVIADVRFPNEIKSIHDMGGKIVRIKRGPEPEWYEYALLANKGNIWEKDRFIAAYPEIHYSEWAWVGGAIDFTIANNGDLNDLSKSANTLIASLDKHVESNYVD